MKLGKKKHQKIIDKLDDKLYCKIDNKIFKKVKSKQFTMVQDRLNSLYELAWSAEIETIHEIR